jgi:hypothetical protein
MRVGVSPGLCSWAHLLFHTIQTHNWIHGRRRVAVDNWNVLYIYIYIYIPLCRITYAQTNVVISVFWNLLWRDVLKKWVGTSHANWICVEEHLVTFCYLRKRLIFKKDRFCGLVVSSWLQIQRSRVPFPALPDFLSSGSGTGSTQPREYNWGATWKEM